MPLWTQGKGQVWGRRDSNRGGSYSYVRNGVEVTAKWPRPRGHNLPQKTLDQMEYFRQVQWAFKYSAPAVQTSFSNAVRGTPLMPRDLFLMVQSGRAFLFIDPDGMKWFPMATIRDVSASLDALGQIKGVMLIRGEEFWQAIDPPSAGAMVLTSDDQAGAAWQTPSGGAGSYERTRVVPTLASWTLQNAGSGGTAAVATDTPFGIQLVSPSTSSNIRMLRRNGALPAGDWTFIARGSPINPDAGGLHYNRSIVLRRSSDGRIIIAGSFNGQWLVQRWTNYTTFSATAYGPTAWAFQQQLPWHRVRKVGANYLFDIGPDGEVWFNYLTEAAATFIGTADEVGFGNMVNGHLAHDLFQSGEVA